MPKSKHGPALFEVYGKGRPDEVRERAEGLEGFARHSRARESASAFRATLTSLARSIGGSGRGEDSPLRDSPGAPSGVAVEDGRIHFALTSRGAGLALFALVALAAAVFLMGRWVGRQGGLADGRIEAQLAIQGATLDEIAAAREAEPVEGLFDGIGQSPVVRAKTDALPPPARLPKPPTTLTAVRDAPTTWVKGNTYVIVQSFRGDAREDAVRALEYLAQQGIATQIVGSSDRGYRLIATQGFNRKDDTQRELADRFIKRIRSIGQAYFDSGGRYKLSGYFATLTSDTW